MATLERTRFASIVRMLQTAYPKDWEKHLHNLGVTTTANPPPANLDRIMKRVFWMVPQAGIKNPAAWIEFDMARVEATVASVELETSLKVAFPIAVRQKPVELEPVKLGMDQAKTPGASPLASEPGIKDPAAGITADMARVEAASASVKPEATRKVAPPIAVRQKLPVDPAKTSGASLLELETAIVIDQQLSWAKLSIAAGKRREAADAMFAAHEVYGASQQNIAAAVGKCQAWVSCMIWWRREKFKDHTPFGPASKDARERARIGRLIGRRVPRQRKLRRRRR